MQGLYSSYDATGPVSDGVDEHTFDTLKAAFIAQANDGGRLLDFSYTGGIVQADGTWKPNLYRCEITDRLAEENLAPLERMLRDYRQAHPEVHFTLVGHSLGGYLAFLEGARDAARPEEQKLAVDVVVTLDSPLSGVSADKQFVLDSVVHCPKTYAAGAELVRDKQDPETPELRRRQTTLMHEQGVRLATIGNINDCLYNLRLCIGGSYVDDSSTQFLEGAELSKRYEIRGGALASHFSIVRHAGAVNDVITFVGAP